MYESLYSVCSLLEHSLQNAERRNKKLALAQYSSGVHEFSKNIGTTSIF